VKTRLLTSRQSRFVAEYRKSRNAAAAARAAGYTSNQNSVKVIAWHLLRKPQIATALATADATGVDLVNHDEVPIEPGAEQPARRGGPKSILTKEITDRVCESISHGLNIGQAAALAGISRDALEKWRTAGKRGLEPYASFLKAYEQAELECQANLVRIWTAAAPSDWRACKEFLARRWPRTYSDHAGRLEVFGVDGRGTADRGPIFNITIHQHPRDWYTQKKPAEIDVTSTPVPPKDPDPNSDLN
jgi:Terminase small subunit